MFSRKCNWNLAKTQIGIVLEYFRGDAIWSLAKTKIGIVLEYFRGDAIGIWLRHNLELS